MMDKKRLHDLSLRQILERTIKFCEADIKPLFKYLEFEEPSDWKSSTVQQKAHLLDNKLCRMGSNDIATLFRGDEPVEYKEIVYDVGKKLKANVAENYTASKNEEKILEKLFGDILDKMSDKEKKELLKSMGISEGKLPAGPVSTILAQQLLKQTGFWLYKSSLIVANTVARAILGRGLTLAANATLTRSIGVLMGPVGWIASGLWLVVDLAGPAFRCTVPSVVHIAMLRQMLLSRINIGVVGDGSTGKDSMIECVFGIETGKISPIAGSTSEMETYELGNSGAVFLTNYPGFNDIRPSVNKILDDQLHHTDVFILVVDISRGISNTDIEIFRKVDVYKRPILVCLNKTDLPREEDLKKLIEAAYLRIKAESFCETQFKPDPRLTKDGPKGCDKVHGWICEQVEKDGKQTDHIPQGRF